MILTERIQEYVQRLPTSVQAEVLDFVEYLMAKTERQVSQQEDSDWANLSLSSAMRGMEGEDSPVYTTSDLKAKFS
jgi:hypothetical protein